MDRAIRRRSAGSGHDVRAAQPVKLDAVLHGPQETVGAVELRGVRSPDVAMRRELLQREQGRRAADEDVAASVHQLKQLDRELDVAQPTPAELELAVCVPAGTFSSTLRRMARASSTKPARSAAPHTSGATAST